MNKCKETNGTIESYLNKLEDVTGIGSVYAVTLRYFMEDKEVLIYDQFAQRGIDAIRNKAELHKLKYKEPTFTNMKDLYTRYEECVKCIFGNKWCTREVDQVLWVYGHLFK